jgi:hypothetical protein
MNVIIISSLKFICLVKDVGEVTVKNIIQNPHDPPIPRISSDTYRYLLLFHRGVGVPVHRNANPDLCAFLGTGTYPASWELDTPTVSHNMNIIQLDDILLSDI